MKPTGLPVGFIDVGAEQARHNHQLLVTVMAACGPVAYNVVMLSMMYGNDTKRACEMNVLSLLWGTATMPIMVLLYQLLVVPGR